MKFLILFITLTVFIHLPAESSEIASKKKSPSRPKAALVKIGATESFMQQVAQLFNSKESNYQLSQRLRPFYSKSETERIARSLKGTRRQLRAQATKGGLNLFRGQKRVAAITFQSYLYPQLRVQINGHPFTLHLRQNYSTSLDQVRKILGQSSSQASWWSPRRWLQEWIPGAFAQNSDAEEVWLSTGLVSAGSQETLVCIDWQALGAKTGRTVGETLDTVQEAGSDVLEYLAQQVDVFRPDGTIRTQGGGLPGRSVGNPVADRDVFNCSAGVIWERGRTQLAEDYAAMERGLGMFAIERSLAVAPQWTIENLLGLDPDTVSVEQVEQAIERVRENEGASQ